MPLQITYPKADELWRERRNARCTDGTDAGSAARRSRHSARHRSRLGSSPRKITDERDQLRTNTINDATRRAARRPALRSDPLAAAAELVGPAPLRFFAPGPFEGEWSSGLGGLLRASTAIAVAVHPIVQERRDLLEVQLALVGAWGTDALAATQRLAAALGLLFNDSLGRLLGLDRP